MAEYQNYNNNSRENNDTNTRGRQYYNSEGTHKSTLVLNFWNKMVSLKIHPALPPEKITQNEKFDYNQAISTALSTEKALKIADLINTEVIPALTEGRTVSKGVPIGTDSALVVGVNEDSNGHYAFLAIAKNIDVNTKTPKDLMVYQFSNHLVIDHYDFTNGEFEASSDNGLEVREFQIQLLAAVESLIGAQAHAMRHVDKYWRDKLSEATGVRRGNGAPYSGGGNTSSVFGTGNKSSSPSQDVDRSTLDNVNQISSFTDMM